MGETLPLCELSGHVSGARTRDAACSFLYSRCAPGFHFWGAGRRDGLESQRLVRHVENGSAVANGGGRGVVVGIAVVGAVDGGRASWRKGGLVAQLLEAPRVARRRMQIRRGSRAAGIIDVGGI